MDYYAGLQFVWEGWKIDRYILFTSVSMFILIIIMAVFLLHGKGAFLITGYNTMSKHEKAHYNEKALCRFTGLQLLAIAFCLIIFHTAIYFDLVWMIYCGALLVFAICAGGSIYTKTNKRFRNKTSTILAEHENSKLSAKNIVSVSTAISLVVLIIVGVLIYQGDKEPVIYITDTNIQIHSVYGLNVDFSEIANISLIEESMSDIGVGIRTNGYGGIGETLKGHFKSDSLGATLLFVQAQSFPTIWIKRIDKKDIYISFRDGKKTEELYRDMIAAYR